MQAARSIVALFVVLALMAFPASAQEEPEVPALEILPETIEIGLSKDIIAITSDFAGEDLTIFGAVDNVDPLVFRQGRYDIVVILEGPTANSVVRRKGRVFGIWMNVAEQQFNAVPQSYLISSTRVTRDITNLNTIARLSLGVGQIRLLPDDGENQSPEIDEFTSAMRRLKGDRGLFREFPGGVRFISQSLFRADLRLPANVPIGLHRARAFLFRNGELRSQTQANLAIRKAGLEYQLYDAAHNRSLLFGIASVLMALLVGWLGRVIFRKD